MNHRLLFATLAAALLAAGCKPSGEAAAPAAAQAPAAAPAEAGQAAADAHPTDVISEVDNAPAPEGLDVRAFAGTFGGTLPCADCPGIDTALELKADGTYALHRKYRERDAASDGDGTWTVEEGGRRIRLDPNSKQDEDSLYEVVSNDELRMLDADGKAIESGLDYALRRRVAAK